MIPRVYATAGLALALTLAAILVWRHYDGLRDRAAKLPALEAALHRANASAEEAWVLLTIEQERRESAERRYAQYQIARNDVLSALRASTKDAPIQTNRDCAPGVGDRELRNNALAQLLRAGADPGTGRVPQSPELDDRSGAAPALR